MAKNVLCTIAFLLSVIFHVEAQTREQLDQFIMKNLVIPQSKTFLLSKLKKFDELLFSYSQLNPQDAQFKNYYDWFLYAQSITPKGETYTPETSQPSMPIAESEQRKLKIPRAPEPIKTLENKMPAQETIREEANEEEKEQELEMAPEEKQVLEKQAPSGGLLEEIRKGKKLKKVSVEELPQKEQSPESALLEEIRQRNPLRKVTETEKIKPEVKKTGHEALLEELRKGKALKKASERELPELTVEKTKHEQLLEQIRQGKPLKKVAPQESELENA
ncbi:MAG: WH2 domain-containing protein [Candidatus Babeliaceae bacterium]